MASTATKGDDALVTATPSVEDSEAVDMLARLLDALSAANALVIISRTVRVTLPAVTVITTSTAPGNSPSSAARTAESSKDATSAETVRTIDTTDV